MASIVFEAVSFAFPDILAVDVAQRSAKKKKSLNGVEKMLKEFKTETEDRLDFGEKDKAY